MWYVSQAPRPMLGYRRCSCIFFKGGALFSVGSKEVNQESSNKTGLLPSSNLAGIHLQHGAHVHWCPLCCAAVKTLGK